MFWDALHRVTGDKLSISCPFQFVTTYMIGHLRGLMDNLEKRGSNDLYRKRTLEVGGQTSMFLSNRFFIVSFVCVAPKRDSSKSILVAMV